METKTKIVIAGAGFGGLNSALFLWHALKRNWMDAEVTLIDQHDYHVYYPSIYEAATSEEEFVSIDELKKTFSIPFSEILPKGLNFIQGKIESIDQQQKFVLVDGNKVQFDYLVVALGSTVDYFGTPGLKENSLTLKSFTDAIRLRNAFEFLVDRHRFDMNKENLKIVMGGGGSNAIELTGELCNLRDILSWKYNYPREKIEVMIIEGMDQLLPGFPGAFAQRIHRRLEELWVRIKLGNLITEVTNEKIILNNGESVEYDLLVWNGGVRSVKIPFAQSVATDKKDRCESDQYLRLKGSNNIFVLGDNACIMDPDNKPLPPTAAQAIDQAHYVSETIIADIQKRQFTQFKPGKFPTIVPVYGKWAAVHFPSGMNFYGIMPWFLKLAVEVRYLYKLMSLTRALRAVFNGYKIMTRND